MLGIVTTKDGPVVSGDELHSSFSIVNCGCIDDVAGLRLDWL